jgi:hypothetical protein
MATTLFYHFIVTFLNAAKTPHIEEVGQKNRFYNIVETPQHSWTIFENERLVAISDEQQVQLMHLLSLLQPEPIPLLVQPTFSGCDGICISVTINRECQQTSYRWWVCPPPEWEIINKVTKYVMHLANIPREILSRQQQDVTRGLFERIANRDLAGMMMYYHPDIQYRNPFLELQGVEFFAMWRMCWSYLQDIEVKVQEGGLRVSFVYWEAHYTYPPTGRYIKHSISSDLTFAEDKVILHVDRFNVHQWASSAYGYIGEVAGGWRLFEKQIAAKAKKRLNSWLNE